MQQCDRAVLVSVNEFEPGVDLRRRPGAKRDTKRLHRVLKKLGFWVEIHNDLQAHEIYELFQRESSKAVHQSFLAVLSSHGEDGCVFGSDGQPVWLSRIFQMFDNKEMESKTKMFLVQACRGDALDDGVQVDSSEEAESLPSQYFSLPVETAVMYATVPGYGAYINLEGSVFLQTFCSLLEDQNQRRLELTRLMTRLSHHVAFHFRARGSGVDGKREMPCLLTSLTRDAFPFAPVDGKVDYGTRLVSLVTTFRTRTRSIS
ncbi:caspase-7-like [Synchiropus splendidus]|uniref:caspase-7-like n=1 Tax=Synchiropus splendidus TaxID=270530 RepID=UPI00237DCB1C|nr:caspase-7-like [Synchiropus splendidus]